MRGWHQFKADGESVSQLFPVNGGKYRFCAKSDFDNSRQIISMPLLIRVFIWQQHLLQIYFEIKKNTIYLESYNPQIYEQTILLFIIDFYAHDVVGTES